MAKFDRSSSIDDALPKFDRHRFAIALFLSGCAALAYQVAWQRVLTQIIGSDAISMVLVVTIFMICLGIGAELARYLVSRPEAEALRLYALIEIVVATYGFISIPLLRFVNAAVEFGVSLTFDFALNLLLLALPIVGMGLTTPLIIHVSKQRLQNVGRIAGTLYGWNIAGAATGAVLTGIVLIELTGLIGTARIAAFLNLSAAAVAIFSLKSIKSVLSQKTNVLQAKATVPAGAAIAAISFGFGTLAIQVLFFRILTNYLTLSTIVFPMVLCAYLFLMALGQWLGGHIADRFSNNLISVIMGLFTSGAFLFLAALHFPPKWAALFGALRFTTFNGQLIAGSFPGLIGDPSPITVLFFSFFLMIPVLSWSGLFPVMFRLITSRVEEAGDGFARMYSLYTIGNVLGAFVCGIVFLPAFGTGGSANLTVLIVGLGCMILLISQNAGTFNARRSWAFLIIGVFCAFLMPQDYYKKFELGDYKIADVIEGRNGVASVVHTAQFYTIIDINRTASASALKKDPAPSDQYQAWRWNHTELMALDRNFRPKTILVIGIGHAYLIDSMLDLPFVEKITIVDISSEIVQAVKQYTHTSAKRIFTDPRVEIVIADGRRYVQSALKRGEQFDLIQNKINEPWHAGGGNLFTKEFFRDKKSLLSPGGYLSTRPLTGHLSDGFEIFGNAIWAGYYHMYFKNGEFHMPKSAMVTSDIEKAWSVELPGKSLRSPGIRKSLKVALFSDVPAKLATDPNTDDHPTFEYCWLKRKYGKWRSPRLNFWYLDFAPYTKTIPVNYQGKGRGTF